VPIVGDTLHEPAESFLINLSSPAHATIAGGHATVTVHDDDAARATWGDFAPTSGTPARDGAADAAIFNPATHLWRFVDSNTGGVWSYGPWGDTTVYGDVFVPHDYDGDGKTDFAVYRPFPSGVWYVAPATGAPWWGIAWGGAANDVAVPGDYDGDGSTDLAVYRPSEGYWRIRKSSTQTELLVDWGIAGGTVIPTAADYDGDGKTDVAFYQPSTGYWYIVPSSTGIARYINWGIPGATVRPAAADYDGDGKADLAFYHPADQYWYIVRSTTEQPLYVNWGASAADIPVPADYDADGKTDVAFYRPSDLTFYIVRSSSGQAQYISIPGGTPADLPLLRRPQ
jgi:hypothetical protein